MYINCVIENFLCIGVHHSTTIHPPNKNYLPPKDYGHSTMAPPSMNYHSPEPHYSTTIKPPLKDYLPPKIVEHHHKPHYKSSPHDVAIYHPPVKEYLPPIPTSTPKPHIVHKGHLEISTVKPGYHSTFEPPVKAYLPPPSPTLPPPTPNREYLSPLEEVSYQKPEPEVTYHAPEVTYHAPDKHHSGDLTLCPHFQPSSYCEPAHECWSPGVPDEDCPHNGHCCFNGCSNVCLMNKDYHTSYHRPKHNAHKVPGHDYVEITPDHKVITTGKYITPDVDEMVYHLVNLQDELSDYSVPPIPAYVKDTYDIPELKHHPDHHIVESYKPPVKEYLPPKNAVHYDSPKEVYIVPKDDYLPPKVPDYAPPSDHHEVYEVEYHSPKPLHADYQVPKKEYLPPPPTLKHEVYYEKPKDAYKPPVKEYLPPKPAYSPPPPPKAPIEHYHPPTPTPKPLEYTPSPKPVEPIAAYVPPPTKPHAIDSYVPPIETSYKSHKEDHHDVHEIEVHPVASYNAPDNHHKEKLQL